MHVPVARLLIKGFEFYCKVDDRTPTRLVQLCTVVSNVIEVIAKADEINDVMLFSSHLLYRITSLAGAMLLRIVRSHVPLSTNTMAMESLYFTCVQLLKKRSLQNDDLDARAATLLTQLWSSEQVFRHTDGSIDSLRVRVRNRGVSLLSHAAMND
jgi:transcriptional regulatory protein LEU3